MRRMEEPEYPAPESRGGWRWLETPEAVREVGGMDAAALRLAAEAHALQTGTTASVVVVRHGWLVAEWHEVSALATTRFDVWSCTKSFTGTAYGLLFGDRLDGGLDGGLDAAVYDALPEGQPLTDPRKAAITFRHLLSMTSGIPGESAGLAAVPTRTGTGPFEAALGIAPCWARRWGEERWASTLMAEPGTRWDYSDPAFAHLGMAFTRLAGRQMRDVMQERVFAPIGMESVTWDLQGVGTRFGPHTNAHTGVHVSARELARLGYLMLHGGRWAGRQVLSADWVALATRPSQVHNPSYGLTWWVNATRRRWPSLPADAFAALGLHGNGCYVIPSLDLVVARTANGPISWADDGFIGRVAGAVRDAGGR